MNSNAPTDAHPDPEAHFPPAPSPSAGAEVANEALPRELPFIAYSLPGENHVPLVPASPSRAWMREENQQFAHRCLPLLIANQAGWFLLNTHAFTATWTGDAWRQGLSIEYHGERPRVPHVGSIFGNGILTWYVGYLFRTPPGFNLQVSGPSNMAKDGIEALRGVVETDWAVATFTMNWRILRPNQPISFGLDEPFCMIAPQRRHDLEAFNPRIIPLESDPELAAQWRIFEDRRTLMIGMRRLTGHLAAKKGGEPPRVPYERHYFEGTSPGGASAPEHQKRLVLKPFQDPPVGDGRSPG